MKPIEFCGSALDDLRSFPHTAMREAGYQLDLFSSIIPKQILKHVPLQSIAPEQVYASAVAQPFQGRLLKEWGQKLEADRLDKITSAVRTGFLQGETVEQIVKRVAGTPKLVPE